MPAGLYSARVVMSAAAGPRQGFNMSASIHNAHFLLRRLHSLFGLVPVGAFLLFHLWENSQSRFGADHYNQQVVGWLQSLNYLALLELLVIALPLAFHAGYGLVIVHSGRTSLSAYPYWHNRLYWLQRISGGATLLFLLLHLATTRWVTLLQPGVKTELYQHMQGLLADPWYLSIYVAGLLLALFHFCYGLWSMMITWGVTLSPAAQRRSFLFCMALMIPLSLMGLQGIWGFLR
jgi:succinate dehydrogenase / fumarate reductase cytochrome b subunit